MIEVLSGASAGAASTTFGGSPGDAVGVADAVTGAPVTGAEVLAAAGAVTVAASAFGVTAAGAIAGIAAVVFGNGSFGDAFAEAEAAA